MVQRKPVKENDLDEAERVYYSRMVEVAAQVDSLLAKVLEEKVFREVSESERGSGKEMIRFLQDVPAIVGVDMRKYGPFKAEDVASVPIRNVDSLIKHGLAKKVISREDT
jgi:DNA replication factor GINS